MVGKSVITIKSEDKSQQEPLSVIFSCSFIILLCYLTESKLEQRNSISLEMDEF